MAYYELETMIPAGAELLSAAEEDTIIVEDRITPVTGTYKGRIAGLTTFTAKTGEEFAKITLGCCIYHNDKRYIFDFERVYRADYHMDSELMKLLSLLGVIEDKKARLNLLHNMSVQFTLKDNPKAETSQYKYFVEDIKKVDSLTDAEDLTFYKVPFEFGFKYKAVMAGAKLGQSNPAAMMVPQCKKFSEDLPEDDEEDSYLDSLDDNE